jgi:putative transposase
VADEAGLEDGADHLALAGLTSRQREQALARYRALAPHLHEGIALRAVAAASAAAGGPALRTLERWLGLYKAGGLAALARPPRVDKGRRRLPAELVALVEGLALKTPRQSVATIHRIAVETAGRYGWPVPGYAVVYDVVRNLDPALQVMAHEGDRRYREVYELVYRREAKTSNEIWQADHTELDLWVLDDKGKPARPWLTIVEDDYSRAAAGYAVNLDAPSALATALAFRQAIWRKADPSWHVCGIPTMFYVDHGSDFTSRHLEQVMADLRVRPVFSKKGEPRGRGKVERMFGTINQMCLPHLPGYAPRGTPDRKGQAKLTLAELDAAIGAFLVGTYNQRVHSETGQPPQQRWETGAFLPRMPDSLEQLDLLLLTVAKPRKIHTDGIHFESMRYLDPVLAHYVGEQTTIRYDPRDLAEIRVYLSNPAAGQDEFLCRAICPDLSDRTVSLKDITAARNARRRELRGTLKDRAAVVDHLIAAHTVDPDPPYAELGTPRVPAPAPPAGSDAGRHASNPAPSQLKGYLNE